MHITNQELVQRWFEEVWNKQSEEAIDEMFAPGSKCYGFPESGSVVIGPEDFKAIHRTFLAAFPDLRITVNDIICEGERVAATWVATMTHLGDNLGFAATMQRVFLEGCSVLIVRNGQIHEGRNYMEIGALMHRLQTASVQAAEPAETSFA